MKVIILTSYDSFEVISFGTIIDSIEFIEYEKQYSLNTLKSGLNS